MQSILDGIFSVGDYMPHGMCLLWQPALMALHIVSDGLIAASYFTIPAALIYFVTRRRDLPFQAVFVLFGVFIVACGLTHVMSVVTLWHPLYQLDGYVKAVTAVASVLTAIMVWRLMPQAIALPSMEQLSNANRALSSEMTRREQVERQMRDLNATLEDRVERRTLQLAAVNAALRLQIEDRERAEQKAEASHARLTDAIEALPASFSLFDRDECLVIANSHQPATKTPIALTPGVSFSQLARAAADQELDRTAQGRKEEWLAERIAVFRAGDADVETQWHDGHWYRLQERRTSEGGTVSIQVDVTARRSIEDQLRQAQKLEAVGQLTGGIAHDFNNLLTVILGNAEVLVDKLTDKPNLRAAAQLMQTAAERGANLTSRLLAFSRRQALVPQSIDVNKLVTGMNDLLRRTLGEQVEIEIGLGVNLWCALVDRTQLESALLNLAINARDAMPGGGKLTIETSNAVIDKDYSAAHSDVQPGPYVLVTISDTGTGMSREVATRAFEPFFSTKEVGKGSGLGLSMVYGFVKQSGGHVKIYSEPGLGTTIRVYIPRSAEVSPAADVRAELAIEKLAGVELILVVEDDELVRNYVQGVVRGLGYSVMIAPDGPTALDVLKQQPGIDLLFTDVVMPGGMNGRQLAEAAKAFRPTLKVLFTSGYSEQAIVHHGQLDPDVHLIQKPYNRHALAQKLRLVLDG